MTPVSRPTRSRTRRLFLPAFAAFATLLNACSETPSAGPSQTRPRLSEQLGGQPRSGELNPSAGPSFQVEGAAVAAAPATFTAAPFAADFVVTGSEGGAGGEHYFPSNGDGTFASKSDVAGLGSVDGLDVADMDGDGDNDFVVCDGTTGETYLYVNNGSGAFTPSVVATGITVTNFCTNLRIADFNQDGRNDFVVGDNSLTNGMFVYLQSGPGTFSKVTPGLELTWTGGPNAIFGLAAGDVDRDGHQDVLVLGYNGAGAGQVRFYKGSGTGAMAASVLFFNVNTDFGTSGVNGIAMFDLEGDGDLDIVVGGGNGGDHYVYTNNGSGTFTKPSALAFDVDGQSGVDAFDVDGDGDHDLLVAAFGPRKLFLVKNQGGSLAAPVSVADLAGSSIGVGAPAIGKATVRRVPAGEAAIVTITENGKAVAGIDIPAGTFEEDVTVTVRFVPFTDAAPCHAYLFEQIARCLEVTATDADGNDATLKGLATIGLCLPEHLHIEIFKFDERNERPVALPQAPTPFLNCAGFTASNDPPRNRLEGLAMGLAKSVGRWLTPKPLYAADRGFGGVVGLFDDHLSTFTWASPIHVSHASLALNVSRSGKDVFGLTGTFKFASPVFGADDHVTVGYGHYVEEINRTSFKFSRFLRRFVYAAPLTKKAGILYMDVDPNTGRFTLVGTAPSEGGGTPTFRPFNLKIGDRGQGAGLICGEDSTFKCTLEH